MNKKYLLIPTAILCLLPFFVHAQAEKEITDGGAVEVNVAPGATLNMEVKETVEGKKTDSFKPMEEEKEMIEQEEPFVEEATSPANPEFKSDAVVEINMTRAAEEANVKKGQIVEVTFLEEPPYQWYFEKNPKTISFIGTRKDDNKLIVSYEITSEKGFERLYFDYMDKSNGKVKVLESKILDVTVGM